MWKYPSAFIPKAASLCSPSRTTEAASSCLSSLPSLFQIPWPHSSRTALSKTLITLIFLKFFMGRGKNPSCPCISLPSLDKSPNFQDPISLRFGLCHRVTSPYTPPFSHNKQLWMFQLLWSRRCLHILVPNHHLMNASIFAPEPSGRVSNLAAHSGMLLPTGSLSQNFPPPQHTSLCTSVCFLWKQGWLGLGSFVTYI